jgi:hypothetical protein
MSWALRVRVIEMNPTTIARLRKREIFIGCPNQG